MQPVPRLPLLIAALVVPIAVLLGFALTEGPRTPRVPPEVRVGISPGPSPPSAPSSGGVSTTGPAELPPPPPDDDDDDDQPEFDD